MKAYTGSCPRCSSPFHANLANGSSRTALAVCTKCGWYESQAQADTRIKTENQTIAVMITFAVSLLLISAHMLNWGSHSFSIPVLKVAQWTGTLSSKGYGELAQACLDLGKYPCARSAMIANFQIHRNPEPLAQLARLQIRMQDTNAAMSAFSSYFKNGGRDGDSALIYGQLLEQAGQDADAIKMLEYSITARSTQLPIAATGAIVRILMKQGKYEEARDRINAFHESAGNAKGYLNTELAQVEQAIKMQRGHKAQARR